MEGNNKMFNQKFGDSNLLSCDVKLNEFSLEDSNKLTRDEMLDIITELIDKNSKQENFLLNISHDLRGHLNVILSVIQMTSHIGVHYSDKRALEYTELIRRNSLKMLRLINNLIDTTKLENNYYVLNKKNIDIISMVESTINCIDKYAKQKNIQLIFDTNEEECVMGVDPEVVDRIIMNLLSNAIKFSNSNTNIYIDIFVIKEKIQISIRDEGPGISKEYQDKIFNRFYQMSRKRESESIGSGIGLDLVNYLVKSMDGEIKLKSKEGEGCEFILTFPIEIVEEKENYCLNDNKSNKIQMLEIEFSDIYNN